MASDLTKPESYSKRRIIYYAYWVLVLPCIWVFLLYFTAGIIHDYATTPYGSVITVESLKSFPAVSLCPTIWYDKRKASDVVDNNDALLGYILRFTENEIENEVLGQKWQEFDGEIEDLRSSYEKLRKKFKSHTSILKAIALDPSKLLELLCSGCDEDLLSAEIVAKSEGVCFKVNEFKVVYGDLELGDNVNLQFMVNKTYVKESQGEPHPEFDDEDEDGLIALNSDNDGFILEIGNSALAPFMDDTVDLHMLKHYNVHVDITVKTTLESCDKNGHFQSIYHKVQDCALKRFMQYCDGAECIYYAGPVSDIAANMTLCHPDIPDEYEMAIDCWREEMNECNDEIVYPCNEMITHIIPQAIQESNEDEDTAEIYIFPQNSRSTLHLKEFQSFTWNGFVGNFGGLFGVSLGASLCSLAEIIYSLATKIMVAWNKRSIQVIQAPKQ